MYTALTTVLYSRHGIWYEEGRSLHAMDKIIHRVKLSYEAVRGFARTSLSTIDDLIDRASRGQAVLDLRAVERMRDRIRRILPAGYRIMKASVIIPAGLMSFFRGLRAADADIRILGIGRHRFFLFHSALGVVVLRYFYRLWREHEQEDSQPNLLKRSITKVAGGALSAYALGVGVHLAIDVVQPKAVIFPFFGSLVKGTLIDDNIWLLGNSLWAFKIARDVFVISFAPELESAKRFVREQFADWAEYGYQSKA